MAKNNLFAIDLEAVLSAVAEANTALVDSHRKLMEALHRVPERLEGDDDIARAKRFAEQLKDHASRCRAARLSDVKPLSGLVKQVESFFKGMEKQSNTARDSVMAALTDAGRRRAAIAAPPSPQPTPTTVILNSGTGEVLGATQPAPARPVNAQEPIPLAWFVGSVDRDTLDLEELRPFLTEAALMTAARAHLKVRGPHALTGASYEQRAAQW